MLSISEVKELQNAGLFGGLDKVKFQDAQMQFTPNNIGMPAGILSQISPDVLKNILKSRTGEEALGGSTKLINWEQDKYYIPFIENTGQTTPYSDFGMPLYSSLNITFGEVGHYLFSASYNYGSRTAMQISNAKINYLDVIMESAMNAIKIEYNRTLWNGYLTNSGNAMLVYGLLNNPNLSNFEALQKSFASMTWQETLNMFAGAIIKLSNQTGNVIKDDSYIRCVIASNMLYQLQIKYTDLGISVFDEIKKRYPNMSFVNSVELNKAETNKDCIYFIAENEEGGALPTTTAGYSELYRAGDIERASNSYSQVLSAGTNGAVVYKNLFIVRYKDA